MAKSLDQETQEAKAVESHQEELTQELLWPIVRKLAIVQEQLEQNRSVMAYRAVLELKEHLAKGLGLSFMSNVGEISR